MDDVKTKTTGCPPIPNDESPSIIFDEPTEFFEIVPKLKSDYYGNEYYGMPIIGFRIPLEWQKYYKSPLELIIRKASQASDIGSTA